MRLHVVSLPHTQTTSDYLTCAYTMKVVKFCKMMLAEGYEVILYSGEYNEAECTEHVMLIMEHERREWMGGDGFDTALTPFLWDINEPYWYTMNHRAIPEILKRADEHDFLCLIGGSCQSPIAQNVPLMAVEWGVGYEGIFAKYCAFESYAWMHHVYGKLGIVNGRAYDAVIPNFFDPDDFMVDFSGKKSDDLLYLGRVVDRKGPHIAGLIAERLGRKLIVAGPGAKKTKKGLTTMEGTLIPGEVEYVGTVDKDHRTTLLAEAACVLTPTIYIEPFGGAAVEAMLSGTPVVASDWGAFTETVPPNVGRRFRTLAEGVVAVEEAVNLDAATIRWFAERRYGLDAVGPRFRTWFDHLETLWDKGWYT